MRKLVHLAGIQKGHPDEGIDGIEVVEAVTVVSNRKDLYDVTKAAVENGIDGIRVDKV